MKQTQVPALVALLLITVLFGVVKIFNVFPTRVTSSSLTAQVLRVTPVSQADALKRSQDLLTRLSNLKKETEQIDTDIKAAVLSGQVEIVVDASSPTISFSKPDTNILYLIDSVEKTLVIRNKSNRPISAKNLKGLGGAFTFKGGRYPGQEPGTTAACKDIIAAKSECTIVVLFDPTKAAGVSYLDGVARRYRVEAIKFEYGVAGKNLESTGVTLDGKAYLPTEVAVTLSGEQLRPTRVGDTGEFVIRFQSTKTKGDTGTPLPFTDVSFSPLAAPFRVKQSTCIDKYLTTCEIHIAFAPVSEGAFPLALDFSVDTGGVIQKKQISLTALTLGRLAAADNLLVVYNEEWPESEEAKNYYLANRPGFSTANTLGVHYVINPPCPGLYCLSETIEQIPRVAIKSLLVDKIREWIEKNPTKNIQYIVLMSGLPNRGSDYPDYRYYPSVQVLIQADIASKLSKQVLVTSLNMGSLEATKRYIDKLGCMHAAMPGTSVRYINQSDTSKCIHKGVPEPIVVISSQNTGKGGTTYYFSENQKNRQENAIGNGTWAKERRDAMRQARPSAPVIYRQNTESSFAQASNVLGFASWGSWGDLTGMYPLDGSVKFTGNSGWYLIQTFESHNGQWVHPNSAADKDGHYQGNFIKWFSRNAFGGSNYENTPVVAVTHVDEPGSGINDPSLFVCWDEGKIFVECAWRSRTNEIFQAIGDPLVTK